MMASHMDTSDHIPVDMFAAQQALLVERLQILLVSLDPELRNDVVLALKAPGKLLSNDSSETEIASLQASALSAGAWPLLTLLIAQHLAPELAVPVAADVAIAVECCVCAIDLLDDAIDGDQTPLIASIGVPRMVNVSTALLVLAQRAILSLSSQGVAPERILSLLDALQDGALTVTEGQHRDLLAEQRSVQEYNQEICLEIAAAKAGALMRMVCLLGALCAGADAHLCALCAKLGELLGIAHQLDNDCHDISAILHSTSPLSSSPVKTDIQRGKKTLPLVLAATTNIQTTHGKDQLQEQAPSTDDNKQEDERRALREGILTTWGICLLYRERARDCLLEIEANTRPIAPALHSLLGLK